MSKEKALKSDRTLAATPKPQSKGKGVYAGLSREERIAKRRAAFMDAGFELFGSLGYRKTTVRALCREAGLTDRYFYESFDDTEALLKAVYEQCLEGLRVEIIALAEGLSDGGDLMALLEQGVDTFFETMSDSRVARIVMIEVQDVSEYMDGVYSDQIDQFSRLLIGFAREAYPDWITPEDESLILGQGLVGAMRQMVIYWRDGGYREPKATLVSASKQIFLGLIQQGRP